MKLRSLYIDNFRCLKNFEVKKIGNVNLIVGKNNTGKTSVLEAIRLYATDLNSVVNRMMQIEAEHDEIFKPEENLINKNEVLPFKSLFYG